MRRSHAVLLVLLLLASSLPAPGVAQSGDGTADQAVEDPDEATVGFADRVAREETNNSIIPVFRETWERAGSLAEAGWSESPVGTEADPAFRLVHSRRDSPFPAHLPSPIPTRSGLNAVTVMNEEGTYASGVDTRLVTPTIDLRYVRGASRSTGALHEGNETGAVLRDLHSAYRIATGQANQGEAHLGPFHYLFVTPPSQWTPVPCPHHIGTSQYTCESLADGDAAEDELKRFDEVDSTVGNVGFLGLSDGAGAAGGAGSGTGVALREDGVYAPAPVNDREGASYVNLTFWHRFDLATRPGTDGVFLEVRERRPDGTWSDEDWVPLRNDTVFNNRYASPSASHHEATTGERTVTYNGQVGESHTAAFVGDSDGLVASTFNLNRYAGTEIQIAFRVKSVNTAPVSNLGWFLDDVVVRANVYARDVGVRDVPEPARDDRVAEGTLIRPVAEVKNYGYLNLTDVAVTFRVTPGNDTQRTLYQDTRTIPRLNSQRTVAVDAGRAYVANRLGDYNLIVNVTYYDGPGDPTSTNLSRRPESSPTDRNNEMVVPFQVHTRTIVDVDVEADPETVQADVGEAKRFTVRLTNRGNTPAGGVLEVTAQRLDRTDLSPLAPPVRLARDVVSPDELPFGRDLTALGTEDNVWSDVLEWDDGVDTPGVYRIRANFTTSEGVFTGATFAFVRATPSPYYALDLEEAPDTPFDPRSIYNYGLDVKAVAVDSAVVCTAPTVNCAPQSFIQPALPGPVSPHHVWFARGDDGQVGTHHYLGLAETELNKVVRQEVPKDPSDVDDLDATRDPNVVDHYWLVREVNLQDVAEAERVEMSFWHTGRFNWTGRPLADAPNTTRSRGTVEVLPSRLVPAGGAVEPVNQSAEVEESGVEPVDERTTLARNAGDVRLAADYFPRVLADYDEAFTWRRDVVDLTPWKGQAVTVRFHLETTTGRSRVNATPPLPPWLIDNVEIRAQWESGLERAVMEDDVEGDSWKNWSVNRGVIVGSRPGLGDVYLIAEGRGWTRASYDRVLPSGWHVTDWKRPVSGVTERSRMLRWGNPADLAPERYAPDVQLSILRTAPLDLSNTRAPALTMLHNYSFLPVAQSGGADDSTYHQDGGSVWMVGLDDAGREVVRELLVPEEGYPATAAAWYAQEPTRSLTCETASSKVRWCTELLAYEDRPNLFTGKSGRAFDEAGSAMWERVTFDLSNFTTPERRDLTYVVEFHAINMSSQARYGALKRGHFGWLIDDLQIVEGDFANDVAVEAMVSPEPGRAVGPDLRVPVAVTVANEGLYAQSGVRVLYQVRNSSGAVIHGPVETFTDAGQPIAGGLDTGDPVKNRTVVFGEDWRTPDEPGTYTVEAWVDLNGSLPGFAFIDDNPLNDLLRVPVEVRAQRSVRVLPPALQPDTAVVTPFVAPVGEARSFTVVVENTGTMREVFDEAHGNAGEFFMELVIRNEHGRTVFEDARPLPRVLSPGQRVDVEFKNAWRPSGSGIYDITFNLHHGNETLEGAAADNTRFIRYTVMNQYLPAAGETAADILASDSDAWARTASGWSFGGDGYPHRADASLELTRPLNLRSIRNAFLTLNHTYGFEDGYDGGVVEMSMDGGRTWTPVPPVEGYPANMSTASPLLEDPLARRGAFTGQSGADGPQPVTTAFNLGAVANLTRPATLFHDTFHRGDSDHKEWTPPQHRGDWNVSDLSFVHVPEGDPAWYSSKSAARLGCSWGVPGDTSGSSKCTGERDTSKVLTRRLSGTIPGDALTLEVSYDEWRGIGITRRPHVQPAAPNDAQVFLECTSCEDVPPIPLDRQERQGYDNNYRGWTENVFVLSADEFARFRGEEVNITFVHHVANGRLSSGDPHMMETDIISAHPGWFIDDVAVRSTVSGGQEVQLLKADQEEVWRPSEPDGWDGWWRSRSYDSTQVLKEFDHRNLWTLRNNTGDDQPAWGERSWRHDLVRGDAGKTPAYVALGPTVDNPERAGGSRLWTEVDLRAAVSNVTLSFNTAFNFRALEFGEDAGAQGLSGGTVVVSVDDGRTWIPIEPKPGAAGSYLETLYLPMFNPSDNPWLAAHTTIGGATGDPEGDSAYGMNGRALTRSKTWTRTAFDLTPFAGQRVLLGFHAYFGTYTPMGLDAGDCDEILAHVKPRDLGCEYWVVDDVRVDANVLDGKEAKLRLRAVTDVTGDDHGWDVSDIRLVGVKHGVNVGVRVARPAEGATVQAGSVPFTIEVVNKGQEDLTLDHVNVTVRLASGEVIREWNARDVHAPAEDSRFLDGHGGEEFAFEAVPGARYVIEAEVAHGRVDEEPILDDNTVSLAVGEVLDAGRMEVVGVTASPNHATPGLGDGMEIRATVENHGFKTAFLQSINATLVHRATDRAVRVLQGSDLASNPGPRFDGAFQKKTYAWHLDDAALAGLPAGLYRVDVAITRSVDGATQTDLRSASAYVGESYMRDTAFVDAVTNESLSSGPWDATGSIAWRVVNDDTRSDHAAFRLPSSGAGGSDTGGASGGSAAHGALTTEVIPLSDVGDNPVVTFYSRHRIDPSVNARGEVRACYTFPGAVSCNDFEAVGDPVTGTSEGYDNDGWVRVSRALHAPEGAEGVRVQIRGYAGQGVWGGWRVDDVAVAAYDVTMARGHVAAPITDDSVKTFRYRVTNTGSFNDTYRFVFVDAAGREVTLPGGWNISMVDAQGLPLHRLRLAPGQSVVVGVRVEIPVQAASGSRGLAPLSVTVLSTTTELVRDTVDLNLGFNYLQRPNLAVWDVEVSDPDLPVGSPRPVVVTVANAGLRPATDVALEVVDTLPPRFGARPVHLTQVDGSPLPRLTMSAGDVRTVVALWTPQVSGPHNLTARADPANRIVEAREDDNAFVLPAPVSEASFPNLHVELNVSHDEPRVGDSVQVTARVTNRGGAPASGVQVHLRAGVTDLLDGEPPHILGRTIAPGESVELTAEWRASFPGEYRIFAKALPLAGLLERAETESDNLAMTTVTVRSMGLTLDAPEGDLAVSEGGTVEANVTLRNHGEAMEAVDVHVEAPGRVSARATMDDITVARVDLPSGGAANITLVVRAPTRIAAGSYPVDVVVRSLNTSQTERVTVPVTVRTSHAVRLQAPEVDLRPGARDVAIEVANQGNAPVRAAVAATEIPAGWRLEADPVELAPYEAKTVPARLHIPLDAPAGVADLALRAATASAAHDATLRVNVLSRAVVNVTVAPGTVEARPGVPVDFNVTLESVGNAPAYVDLALNVSQGWTAALDRPQARLAPGDVLVLPVTVTAPRGAQEGHHAVAVEAVGAEETFRGAARFTVGVPDLAVEAVEATPRVNVQDGDAVLFNVTVRNGGSIGAADVPVAIYVDDVLVGYDAIPRVEAGGSASVAFPWTAEGGEHVVLAVVDTAEEVVEQDEENNAYLRVVAVGGTVGTFSAVQRAVPAPWGLSLVAAACAAALLARRERRW